MWPKYLLALIALSLLVGTIIGITQFQLFIKAPSEKYFDFATLSKNESIPFTIVNVFPHDPNAFTQGLAYDKGLLYEGTGIHGKSSLRKINLTTGEILHSRSIPPHYFGEGITLCNDTIIQLTWRSYKGFIYDKEKFELLEEFNYTTEGWGITFTGESFVMSDGTSHLYFLDPLTFQKTHSVQVHYDGTPISKLNELEYINGEIYANVFLTDYIAQINPSTGDVKGWINLTGLMDQYNYGEKIDVLNGIAYDKINNRLFVTGKYWPYIFEIKTISPLIS
jgi:glutamine cyclotransferase